MNYVYRVIYNDVGIYEAYKNMISKEEWLSFLQNENNNWLPKPPYYGDYCKSYFTQKGFEQFKKFTLPIMLEKLDKTRVHIIVFKMYEDDWQIVIDANEKVIKIEF